MRPLILVTSTTSNDGYKTQQATLGTPYVQAVEQPGASVVIVTPAHDPESRRHLVELAHGLVLTGGEDVAPSRYGEEPHAKLGTVNFARDEMEVEVLLHALARGIPVLAICRGMQLLNVALGGTLYQDIPSQLGGDVLHEQAGPVNSRSHGARVEPDSRLAEIVGATQLEINSFHHQAVRELGRGLRALAWAEDGVVEAVEAPEHPWVFGVQWHPERGEAEMMEDRRHPDRRLFWAFADACRQRANGATPPAGSRTPPRPRTAPTS